MYIFVFYSLLTAIVVSLFFKFNTWIIDDLTAKFKKEPIIEEVIKVEETIVEVPKHYWYTERIERWDFYLKQNFLELAITEYDAALLEEKWFVAYERLYKAQTKLWQYKKAEKNLLSAYSLKKNDKIMIDLVKIKIHKNEFKSAYDLLKTIKTQNVEKDYINFTLNILKLNKKNIKSDIIPLLQKAKISWNINVEAKLKAIQSAIDEFWTYQDWKDEHLFLLIWKALSNGYQFEISNQIIKTILTRRPDYRDWWMLLWYNQLRMWKNKMALESMIKAYEVDPTSPDIQFYLAITHEALWDKKNTQIFYEDALKNWYEPKSQLYQKLAEVYAENKEYKNSVEMYKKMLSKNSKNINYFLLPFDMSIDNLNDYQLWLKIAKWAKISHPKNAISYSILWYAHFLNWNTEEAKKNIQKSIQIDQNLARSYLYAWMISEKNWDTFSAIKQYELAQKKDLKWKIWLLAIKKYNNLIK